jgi:hypothetical protein
LRSYVMWEGNTKSSGGFQSEHEPLRIRRGRTIKDRPIELRRRRAHVIERIVGCRELDRPVVCMTTARQDVVEFPLYSCGGNLRGMHAFDLEDNVGDAAACILVFDEVVVGAMGGEKSARLQICQTTNSPQCCNKQYE